MKSSSTDLGRTDWAAATTASIRTAPIPTAFGCSVQGVVLAGRYAPIDGTDLPLADDVTPRMHTNAFSGTPTWSPPV